MAVSWSEIQATSDREKTPSGESCQQRGERSLAGFVRNLSEHVVVVFAQAESMVMTASDEALCGGSKQPRCSQRQRLSV